MNNTVIQLDINSLLPKARSYFAGACGFVDGNKKHQRMANDADSVLHKGMGGLRPSAIVSAYNGNVLADDCATLDGVSFRCAAFARINPDSIKKFYAFILTVGEVTPPDDSGLGQLYADIWGTVFTDAAIGSLSGLLADDAGGSCHMASFGPGLYGMDISNIHLIFDILNGSAIGVKAHKKSGCMVPAKSYAGFIIALSDASMPPLTDCNNCSGNRRWCRLCKQWSQHGKK